MPASSARNGDCSARPFTQTPSFPRPSKYRDCIVGSCDTVEVQQVERRLPFAREPSGIEQPCHCRCIEMDAGPVDDQFHRVEVGFQPGLHCECAIDRLAQGFVCIEHARRLVCKQVERMDRLSVVAQAHERRLHAGVHNGAAIKNLQHRNHRLQALRDRRIADDREPAMRVVNRPWRRCLAGLGPQAQHAVQHGHLPVACRGARQGLHCHGQCLALRCPKTHGFTQIPHPAAALHVGQLQCSSAQCDRVGEYAIEGIDFQIQVDCRDVDAHGDGASNRGAPVAARDRGHATDRIAIAQVDTGTCSIE